MNRLAQETIRERAVALIRDHFDHINEGDLTSARQDLFVPPGTAEKPAEVYIRTMRELAPFQLVSAVVTGFEDVQGKRHGAVATIDVATSVMCALGNKSSDFMIWYFPDLDKCLIASRPTHWILEHLNRNG